MKCYRFYAEMPEERKSKSANKDYPFFPWTVKALRERAAEGFRCDVGAVPLDDSGRPIWNPGPGLNHEYVSTVIEGNPLSYAWNSASRDYVASRCVRIPEDLARILSPELFRYLES